MDKDHPYYRKAMESLERQKAMYGSRLKSQSPHLIGEVRVRRQWNDSQRIATYALGNLEQPHWDTISGGIQQRAPQPFLHGYVWCDSMISGELSHSCAHGQGPHRIKVCVTRKDNDPAVFEQLVQIAGPKPAQVTRGRHGRAGALL